MASVALVGATGLVGSNILSTLLNSPKVSTVAILARRSPTVDDPESKLRPKVDSDSATWAAHLSSLTPSPQIFFSALGTTHAQAGSLEAQRTIDYDLNLELAKAAKTAGAKVYVLISSARVSSGSMLPYSRLKAELEEAVAALDFEHTILLKPGMIIGSREDSRPAEAVLRSLARGLGAISGGNLKDFWAQDADVIGNAAISAALKSLQGEAPAGKLWKIDQAEILRLGQTEWKSS